MKTAFSTTLFPLVIFFFLVCPGKADEITISGPDFAERGNLVVFEIDEPADWCIVPIDSTSGKWTIDSSRKSCYFASSESGQYTICAAIIVEGKVKLLNKTFINRSNSDPIPPGPVPLPNSDQLADWVVLNINQVTQSGNFVREKTALSESIQSIINGLERGTIRSPSAARAIFRNTISTRLTGLSTTSLKNWAEFLEKLGKEMEKRDKEGGNSLVLIRTLFTEILQGLNQSQKADVL